MPCQQGPNALPFFRQAQCDCRHGRVFGRRGSRLGRILARHQGEFLVAHLLQQPPFHVSQDAFGLNGCEAVVAQVKLVPDQCSGFGERSVARVDVQLGIVHQPFLHSQGDQATAERAVHGGEAGSGDLLEDRHHEA